LKISLKSNRVWIRIAWTDPQGHQHISLIHGFSMEHVMLFHDIATPNGFPHSLGCDIVDQFYLSGCICDVGFEV